MQVKTQMIQMALKQLEPSPHPVRPTWSEEARDELTQPIKEQGVIVPIKVRPIGDHAGPGVHKWEIVYGHRRVEASRRAGRRYIEVVIEDLDDQAALKRTQDPEVRERILATSVADASIVADAVKRTVDDERDSEEERWSYLDGSPWKKVKAESI